MKSNDNIHNWFRELPREYPSPNFNKKVMEQVMTEWRLNPVKYQPIIGKKVWWSIGGLALLLTTLLSFMHSTLSDSTETATQPSLFGFDMTQPITQASSLLGKLTDISPAVAIGVFAIIALWFFDQLFVRTVRR